MDYPIENRTKQRLWIDVDYKRQKTYIYENMDSSDVDKEIALDPGETIFINFYIEQSDFHIEDKDGKRV